MALLQHHLGEGEMEMIFSCMDSHGYITPDQVRQEGAAGYGCRMHGPVGGCGAERLAPRRMQGCLPACNIMLPYTEAGLHCVGDGLRVLAWPADMCCAQHAWPQDCR